MMCSVTTISGWLLFLHMLFVTVNYACILLLPAGYDLLNSHGKLKGSTEAKSLPKAPAAVVAVSDGMKSDGETEGCGDEEMTPSEV